ncbi:MAG: AMP-binding protein [Defluviicoccus sp.]|nr:AMP-binding protein [Defluviicoccus sp.]MDE0384295.1 AMP-binding protein [Defluviicoccus sp.]
MSDLSSWVEKNAAFTPSKTAIRFEGEDIDYARFAETIRGHARALKGVHGVRPGDRVAFLGYNSPAMLALFFACARLGAMFAPLNWRLVAPELAYILADSAPSVLVADADHLDLAREAAADRRAVVLPADGIARDAETARGDDSNPGVARETPCLLVYTSGTTGHPKGAVLAQEAIQVNAHHCIHYAGLTDADRVLTVLPIFHVGGLNILTSPAFYVGGTVILHRRFDAAATLRAIQDDRPTQLVLVPATIQAVIDLPGWADADLSSLRLLTTGSSIVPLHLIDAIHARGIPVCQTYGLTETAPVAIYQKPGDCRLKPRSTGKCGLHCEMAIADDDGNPLPDGESGEILIRGGNVLLEYWNDEEETRRAIRDGWFHTGDVGYRDSDGDVFVDDRKKDIVISGGENVYPAEIEQLVHRMDDVEDVAVVGRADSRWGEVPVAVVVPAAGAAIEAADFLARFDGRLARFKHPKDVLFVDALPRNAMGKTLKHELRETVNRG